MSAELTPVNAPSRCSRETMGMVGQRLSSPGQSKWADDLAAFGFAELDARGSTPPNHQQAILTALATLPADHPQCVRAKMRPGPLLQSLATNGIVGESSELPDGGWRTILRRTRRGSTDEGRP